MTTLLERAETSSTEPPPMPAGRRALPRNPTLRLTAVAAVANAVVALGIDVPLLRPVAGFVALLLVPGLVLDAALRARIVRPVERVLYVVGGLVLGILVVALVLNYVGFRVGIDRPLAPLPMAVVGFVVDAALLAWRGSALAQPSAAPLGRWLVRPLGRGEAPAALAVMSTVVAVIGAVRLNNGADGWVAFAGLALATAALVWLVVARTHTWTADAVTIFAASATLLLGTSLRSWFVIGHDILREYAFFQLTFDAAHWNIGAFPDPYNACLSVTLLPAVVAGFTGLPGAVVFKCLLQLVFALVPVGTYVFGRRLLPRRLAVAATFMVIAFPTFWADMPFLVRQEIAFLFLVLALLAATQQGWTHRQRFALSAAMAIGVVLSHYSTSYILVMTLGLSLAALAVRRFVEARRGVERRAQRRVLVSLPMFGVLVAVLFAWTVPITHTSGHFTSVMADTVAAVIHPGTTAESSDLRYALLPFGGASQQQRLDDYTRSTLDSTRHARKQGVFEPLTRADDPQVAAQEKVAATPLGQVLHSATGLGLDKLNGLSRDLVARLLQLLLLVGVVALVLRRRETHGIPTEMKWLSIGAVGALALNVLLPGLSVEYGVLRAFQQALLIVAPLTVIGALVAFGWWHRRAQNLAITFSVVALLVLSGVVAQLLGGSPAQLHLANSGPYFDAYYRVDQDRAGTAWVARHLDGRPHEGVRTVSTDRTTLADLSNQRGGTFDRTDDSVYPTLVRKDATVLVRSTTVSTGRAQILIGGDLISYLYPMALLDRTKDRLYDNGAVRVYR